jgi:hypothetical protein
MLGSRVPLSVHFESLSNWYFGQPCLERQMSLGALRSGESHKGLRLASRQPRGLSEGILEGPVPMVRPSPRKNMVGLPKILLPWMKQRSGGPQGSIFTERIVHVPGTWFLGGVSWDLVLGF